MRVKFKLESLMSSTSAGDNDIGNGEWGYEISDAMYDGNVRTYRVADGAANQEVDLAGITDVRYIVIRTDQTITVRFSGTESVKVYVPTDFKFGYFVATTSNISSIDISNASGEQAVVVIHLAGNLT